MNKIDSLINKILPIAKKQFSINISEVKSFLRLTANLFTESLLSEGFDKNKILKLKTKFRDAGRRSAPWRAASKKVPGIPQDGEDGNRINRWQLPKKHKFYADEKTATLVEIKLYYQTLSMLNAPDLRNKTFKSSLVWLLGHNVEPGLCVDPIQIIPLDLKKFIDDATSIQCGHLLPLDKKGKHEPQNTCLMLKLSNYLQGNNTIEELLKLLKNIIAKHAK